ncbi:MAG: tRNA (cytidine(34)-2'-O)-methyltransferase [Mollicutes bacterium]|nr:tRNA (cytidine(34)-2'-O)-methyltransferase [Mollicutes bacterium]
MINIVLFEPEIPQNTGNIMRTCVAVGARLHLIKPLGFELSDKQLKRSGMDYIEELDYFVYEDYKDFVSKNLGYYFYITRYGEKTYSDVDYNEIKDNIYLIFGKESTGIDKNILKNNLDHCFRIPMKKDIRSLNLSNCVAIVLYEVLRQKDFFGLSKYETIKEKNYLKK